MLARILAEEEARLIRQVSELVITRREEDPGRESVVSSRATISDLCMPWLEPLDTQGPTYT